MAMEENIMVIKDLNIWGHIKMVNQMEMGYYIINILAILNILGNLKMV